MHLHLFPISPLPTANFNLPTIPTLHVIHYTLLNLLVALIPYLIAPQYYGQTIKLSFLFDDQGESPARLIAYRIIRKVQSLNRAVESQPSKYQVRISRPDVAISHHQSFELDETWKDLV